MDASAAGAVAGALAERDSGGRAAAALAAPDADSLACVRQAVFNGGSGELPLTKGQACDLRFRDDRIMVCPAGRAGALAEVPYRELEAVDVGGPGQVRSVSEAGLFGVVLAAGLAGLLLGALLFGLLGAVLGAILFAIGGGLAAAAATRIETVIRISTADAELYFLSTDKRPDPLRVELSAPLMAIRDARTAWDRASHKREPGVAASIADQLGRLASMLEQGLLTREEFEHLKNS